MRRRCYKVVDLFCGAGGFSRGFLEAGFTISLGIDNLPAAAKTFKYNFPEAIVLAEDIKEVSGVEIRDLVGEVDVVIGSPPCEPYTAANPNRKPDPLDRLYRDPIGMLVLHFIRIVGELKPKVWVMENVPGILDNGLKDALKREFKRVGYHKVYFNILRAEHYGTPSRRVRVFISNVKIKPKKHKHTVKVADALRGLPPPNNSYPPNHSPPPMSDRKLKRIRSVKRGRALIYYEGYGGRKLPNLIRLDPREPAPTVLGSSRFIHPFEDRLLTVREQARLMGYPDNHVFIGGRDEQYNMVGESVPVPLSKAIAEFIMRRILNSN